MVSHQSRSTQVTAPTSDQIIFAGDEVHLAGQIDYPQVSVPPSGYPLIFVIQHATCTSREGYAHIAQLGLDSHVAVFRWDKRGTGRSGAGCSGSPDNDALKAYETACQLPYIDPTRIIILAQLEGSLLLHDVFDKLKTIQNPLGVVLIGNMLDDSAILKLDVPAHIVVSKNDWNDWQTYAEAAAEAHAVHYQYVPSYYVAANTNRKVKYTNSSSFHRGAAESIKNWLHKICQTS